MNSFFQMDGYKLISLTVIACLFYVVHAFEPIRLFIGQPFSYSFKPVNGLELHDASGEDMPSWLEWRKNDRYIFAFATLIRQREHFM